MNYFENLTKKIRIFNENRIAKRRLKRARHVSSEYEFKIGLLAIGKNEYLNVAEFISHYRWQGVQHFFMIDNGSTDGTFDSCVMDSDITVEKYAQKHQQLNHYKKMMQSHQILERCEWILIVDFDEFLFCKDGQLLFDAIDQYVDSDVIYFNWRIFGCEPNSIHPVSLRKCLTLCDPRLGEDRFTKYIVRSSAVNSLDGFGIHKFTGACSSRTISENNKFQFNHYVTQSWEFFESVKMKRGDAVASKNDSLRGVEYFNKINASAISENTLLANMVE